MLLVNDSATWIAVGFALGAVVVALGLAVFVVYFLRRSTPPTRLDAPTDDARTRELSEALDAARVDAEHARELAAIATSVDLDSVLERALEVARRQEGVDAAMITLPGGEGENGEPLVATVGMSADEAARQPASGPASTNAARAIRIAYSYAAEEDPEGDALRGGVSVPLQNDEDEPIGTLAVFWRGPGKDMPDAELARFEELAQHAGPAIENARRYRRARQLADLDALTGLHNRRYFHEMLAREATRAHRYDRKLSLVVLDVDDFKAINDRIGHLAGDSVLSSVAERLQSVVRGADIACRVGGDEFAVILPESGLADAEQLYKRVQLAVASRPLGPFERIRLSAGLAELKPEDDAKSFFERADEALYRAKESGKGRFSAADGLA